MYVSLFSGCGLYGIMIPLFMIMTFIEQPQPERKLIDYTVFPISLLIFFILTPIGIVFETCYYFSYPFRKFYSLL